MVKPRQRAMLEDGRKIDLNKMLAQLSSPMVSGMRKAWTMAGGAIKIVLQLSSDEDGQVTIETEGIVQTIALVSQARHFGGRQWFFICPKAGVRCSVLWQVHGARAFLCRQAWHGHVAYRSQFESPRDRALTAAQRIRVKLGGREYLALGLSIPKPKGMHWSTYDRIIAKCDKYEQACEAYLWAGLKRLRALD